MKARKVPSGAIKMASTGATGWFLAMTSPWPSHTDPLSRSTENRNHFASDSSEPLAKSQSPQGLEIHRV